MVIDCLMLCSSFVFIIYDIIFQLYKMVLDAKIIAFLFGL